MFPDKFTVNDNELPAKIFDTIREASAFAAMLERLDISHRVKLHSPRKRPHCPLEPMQTIVILVEVNPEHGLQH